MDLARTCQLAPNMDDEEGIVSPSFSCGLLLGKSIAPCAIHG